MNVAADASQASASTTPVLCPLRWPPLEIEPCSTYTTKGQPNAAFTRTKDVTGWHSLSFEPHKHAAATHHSQRQKKRHPAGQCAEFMKELTICDCVMEIV